MPSYKVYTVYIDHKVMKILKVNVTIVITLFGAKLHERVSRNFTKRHGDKGMTVNILTTQNKEFEWDTQAFCAIHTL